MKPFLSGRNQVTTATLHPVKGMNAVEAISRANPHPAHPGGAAPTVETVKQGDHIVRLIVTCSCGERIEIDCAYASGS